jgi:hypothetical protein
MTQSLEIDEALKVKARLKTWLTIGLILGSAVAWIVKLEMGQEHLHEMTHDLSERVRELERARK